MTSDDEIVRALRCCGNTDTKKPDCEHCPLLSTRMCVKVMLEGAADLIESQQAQLAESQRREQAAVEDVLQCAENCLHGEGCTFIDGMTGRPDCYGCDNFEWRGPQDTGKGETNA